MFYIAYSCAAFSPISYTYDFFPLNLQGNPFTIMSLSFFKLTVCARRYSHRRISKWSRLSAAGLALDCRAGGRGFDFRGRTNRAFSLTWPASMLIYWNKRKHLHEKRVKLPEDFLGTPTWPPFHCFGTPIWPPWRHVKTLYTQGLKITEKWNSLCSASG